MGDPTVLTYGGRDVLVATSSLVGFKDYMNALTLNFTFDHAVALFKYLI